MSKDYSLWFTSAYCYAKIGGFIQKICVKQWSSLQNVVAVGGGTHQVNAASDTIWLVTHEQSLKKKAVWRE
jgi:hypothetical protein